MVYLPQTRRALAASVMMFAASGCTGKPFDAADELQASVGEEGDHVQGNGSGSAAASLDPQPSEAGVTPGGAPPYELSLDPRDASTIEGGGAGGAAAGGGAGGGAGAAGGAGGAGAGGAGRATEAQPTAPSSNQSSGTDAGVVEMLNVDGGVSQGPDSSVEPAEEPPRECDDNEELGTDNHCYYFSSLMLEWQSARSRCQNRGDGWDLVAVNNADEHSWIADRLQGETWIGGLNQQDGWAWVNTDAVFWKGGVDGEPVASAYTHWAIDEPNGASANPLCLRYTDYGGEWVWADLACGVSYLYACEQTPP